MPAVRCPLPHAHVCACVCLSLCVCMHDIAALFSLHIFLVSYAAYFRQQQQQQRIVDQERPFHVVPPVLSAVATAVAVKSSLE